jgi:hypothetical protein
MERTQSVKFSTFGNLFPGRKSPIEQLRFFSKCSQFLKRNCMSYKFKDSKHLYEKVNQSRIRRFDYDFPRSAHDVRASVFLPEWAKFHGLNTITSFIYSRIPVKTFRTSEIRFSLFLGNLNKLRITFMGCKTDEDLSLCSKYTTVMTYL